MCRLSISSDQRLFYTLHKKSIAKKYTKARVRESAEKDDSRGKIRTRARSR